MHFSFVTFLLPILLSACVGATEPAAEQAFQVPVAQRPKRLKQAARHFKHAPPPAQPEPVPEPSIGEVRYAQTNLYDSTASAEDRKNHPVVVIAKGPDDTYDILPISNNWRTTEHKKPAEDYVDNAVGLIHTGKPYKIRLQYLKPPRGAGEQKLKEGGMDALHAQMAIDALDDVDHPLVPFPPRRKGRGKAKNNVARLESLPGDSAIPHASSSGNLESR